MYAAAIEVLDGEQREELDRALTGERTSLRLVKDTDAANRRLWAMGAGDVEVG